MDTLHPEIIVQRKRFLADAPNPANIVRNPSLIEVAHKATVTTTRFRPANTR